MRLTKRQALEGCRDMWKWIAEHPESHKIDYEKAFPKTCKGLDNNCHMCTYALPLARRYSQFCVKYCIIAKHVWPDGCGSSTGSSAYQEHRTAWFRLMNKESFEGRSQEEDKRASYARKIYEACEKELAKLKK